MRLAGQDRAGERRGRCGPLRGMRLPNATADANVNESCLLRPGNQQRPRGVAGGDHRGLPYRPPGCRRGVHRRRRGGAVGRAGRRPRGSGPGSGGGLARGDVGRHGAAGLRVARRRTRGEQDTGAEGEGEVERQAKRAGHGGGRHHSGRSGGHGHDDNRQVACRVRPRIARVLGGPALLESWDAARKKAMARPGSPRNAPTRARAVVSVASLAAKHRRRYPSPDAPNAEPGASATPVAPTARVANAAESVSP